MEAKILIIFAVAVTAVIAVDQPKLDMTRVIPRQEIPGFWAGRDIQPIRYNHHQHSRRIVGGNEAKPNAHPYQAGLLMLIHWWTGFCGATVIADRIVMTAAHCLEDSNSGQVVLGAHAIFNVIEQTQIRIPVFSSNYRVHPDYNPRMLYNDIALLVLEKTIEFSKYIQPIQLPANELRNENFAGETATVSGWGRFSDSNSAVSEVLRYTRNEIKSNQACYDIFGDFVIESTLCTITRDTESGICNGDSGGPLTVNRDGRDVLVGIVSFGALAGCELGFPTGFVRITYFLDWINSHRKMTEERDIGLF